MKNGTRPTSLDAPLYKLLEQPTTKLRRPFSWKRALRGAAIGAAALASVLAAPLSRAFFLTTYQANARAEQRRAEYYRIVSSALDKTAAQMTTHQWDAQGTASGKAGTIGKAMNEAEYQRRMAAHELTAGDVNRHNRGE